MWDAKASPRDIRMRGFQDRTDLAVAIDRLSCRLLLLGKELTPLTEAAGRILAEDVRTQVAVPGFDRAAMDGFALRGLETFGASPTNPLDFLLVGDVFPGRKFSGLVQPGEAVRIMTGAPLPADTDAIVQAEIGEEIPGPPHYVRITEAVPPGRHVGKRGEDLTEGSVVLQAGRNLRPQDVGVLASIGANPVPVIRSPRVALFITGDELLPCGAKPDAYRIVDSNSVMLSALIKRDGGIPETPLLLADKPQFLIDAFRECQADVVLVSGGSSVGQEDHAPRVLAELGERVVHGLALRPASPAGFGFLAGNRPVFLLPGNPVSCLCAYDLLAGRAIRFMGGRSPELPHSRVTLPLRCKLVSAIGRVDYVRVKIQNYQVEPLATSGASILSSTTRADGFILVPRDSEGLPPGENVMVYLYEDLPFKGQSWSG